MVSLQAMHWKDSSCARCTLIGEIVSKIDVIRFPHVLVWHMHLVAGLMYVASHKCQTEGERIDCPGGGSDTSGFPGV